MMEDDVRLQYVCLLGGAASGARELGGRKNGVKCGNDAEGCVCWVAEALLE